MSTYIYERLPDRFGGHQQAYVETVNTIVKNAADTLISAVQSNQNLTQLFHQTLASFGENRNHIAMTHGTKSREIFGIRRDQNDYTQGGNFALTSLTYPYNQYGDHLLSTIQKQLKTMQYDLYQFQQTESKIFFDPSLGKRSMLEFSILTEAGQKNLTKVFTEKEYQRICKICEVPHIDGDALSIFAKFNALIENKEAMQKLWNKSIKDYDCLKLANYIFSLRNTFPSTRKSDWVHVKVRSEINGKMVNLSEYLTWAYRDFKRDPVDRMTTNSVVSILHQNQFLLETMLDDIAIIFKMAVEWSGKNIKDLKDQMAHFRYEFSHAMPFERGSAAVAEWFERAIYLSHGIDITYDPQKLVDLEALTSSLKEFVDNYDTMLQLNKKIEATGSPTADSTLMDELSNHPEL